MSIIPEMSKSCTKRPKRESNDLMGEVGRGQWLVCIAKRIHAWYISYIYHKNQLNVGVIPYMDPLGKLVCRVPLGTPTFQKC